MSQATNYKAAMQIVSAYLVQNDAFLDLVRELHAKAALEMDKGETQLAAVRVHVARQILDILSSKDKEVMEGVKLLEEDSNE